jgi:hypothetical protein
VEGREGNIKLNLRKTGSEGVDWIYLALGGDQWKDFVNMVIDIQVP